MINKIKKTKFILKILLDKLCALNNEGFIDTTLCRKLA